MKQHRKSRKITKEKFEKYHVPDSIAGLCNLEWRRNENMLTFNQLLFHQLQLGLIDPRPNYDNPKDVATRAMRYSALLVKRMWTMVDRERARVRDVVHQRVAAN